MKSSDDIVSGVADELKTNPPAILASTVRKFGQQRANKQRIAILLSKSRKAGATISKPRSMKS